MSERIPYTSVLRIVFTLLFGKFAAVMLAILATTIGVPLLFPGAALGAWQIRFLMFFFLALFALFIVMCAILAWRTRNALAARGETATAENVYLCIFPDER